jgi:hypothetical protein
MGRPKARERAPGRHGAETAHQDIGQYVKAPHQIELLENHGSPGAPSSQLHAPQCGDVGAVAKDSARARVDQAIDHPQKRGFSSPRATDDPGKAPAFDTERRVGNRSRSAEIPRNMTATANGLAGALYSRVTPPAANAVLCE